ncbi:hypothetical protein [Hippea maritima]|uniref:DUF302 domain-containing protein n=1 Tax=Hippea maritima (strain ATCC 700847 / DSM 10411 / MH2) TaxID=760142 RepID=F2LWW8_HIPMA|nr:hypothetical protein [Hippea maritima]AEA34152.1 hypothetical protein Hipma_1190 [Hippea maritima DSM 10411]
MRKILLMLAAVLFLSNVSVAALTTYELVGSVDNANHEAVVSAVKKALSGEFKIITSYNPGNLKDLTVLVVEDKTYFDAIAKAGRYAYFAAPLRVGIQKNNVMFVNPVYVVDAFAKGKSKLESIAEKTKSKLEIALLKVAGIKAEKKDFGYSTDPDEIGNWQMMGQSIYTIYEVGHKYGSVDKALAVLNDALSAKKNGWSKVYQIKIGDAAVVGVSNAKYEKEAFEIGGYDHLCAFPIELVVYDDGKIKALPEMYRMSLYFMDAGMAAFSAHMAMPGEIDESLKSLLK